MLRPRRPLSAACGMWTATDWRVQFNYAKNCFGSDQRPSLTCCRIVNIFNLTAIIRVVHVLVVCGFVIVGVKS